MQLWPPHTHTLTTDTVPFNCVCARARAPIVEENNTDRRPTANGVRAELSEPELSGLFRTRVLYVIYSLIRMSARI